MVNKIIQNYTCLKQNKEVTEPYNSGQEENINILKRRDKDHRVVKYEQQDGDMANMQILDVSNQHAAICGYNPHIITISPTERKCIFPLDAE